jgi:hypothetical protein
MIINGSVDFSQKTSLFENGSITIILMSNDFYGKVSFPFHPVSIHPFTSKLYYNTHYFIYVL